MDNHRLLSFFVFRQESQYSGPRLNQPGLLVIFRDSPLGALCCTKTLNLFQLCESCSVFCTMPCLHMNINKDHNITNTTITSSLAQLKMNFCLVIKCNCDLSHDPVISLRQNHISILHFKPLADTRFTAPRRRAGALLTL